MQIDAAVEHKQFRIASHLKSAYADMETQTYDVVSREHS